ncbi:Hsp20/alpha crystallin family protein [Bacillus seohaeanensis]|uniref:Hsp20/alpha crystallin family protein n=1 Tax=Bacillus seohaeanensis TaxID=284580 RepID=A0ABW5RVB0_9BACI
MGQQPNWDQLQENMQKVLGDSFWDDMQKVLPRRFPLIDVFETHKEGFVVIEAPGITSQKDAHLQIKGSKLLIEIVIPYTYPVAKEHLLQQERAFGRFKRAVTLPFSFKSDSIQATYENGLFIVKFEKEIKDNTIKFHMKGASL